MAFATELDDIVTEFILRDEASTLPENNERIVFHVSQSKAVDDWKREALQHGTQQHQNSLFAWACDWRDGFGANRTKQNRKSTNAWTFTLLTPKYRINLR